MVLKQYMAPDMANAHAKQIISSQYITTWRLLHYVVWGVTTVIGRTDCYLDKSFPWNALPIEGQEEGLDCDPVQ
jgi:hypothetical protein